MQQLSDQHYQDFKTRMLHNALSQAGFSPDNAKVTFLTEHTRRRVEFKIHHNSHGISLAFHGLRSHNTVTVNHCLVLHPALNALIAPLNEALSNLNFATSLYAVSLTLADHGIDMLLIVKNIPANSVAVPDEFIKALGISRIAVRNPDDKIIILKELSPITMQLGKYQIPLPPGAFLQATQEGQNFLTQIALQTAAGAASVVDLFCGIGTYSFPLSERTKVHAVEGEKSMIQSMQNSIRKFASQNLACEQRDLFKSPLTSAELKRFDAAIINPPRLGAKAQCEQLAQSGIKTIAMISCNPATFARDAKILKNSGFLMEYAEGIDQFLWSQHLEIAAVFKRK